MHRRIERRTQTACIGLCCRQLILQRFCIRFALREFGQLLLPLCLERSRARLLVAARRRAAGAHGREFVRDAVGLLALLVQLNLQLLLLLLQRGDFVVALFELLRGPTQIGVVHRVRFREFLFEALIVERRAFEACLERRLLRRHRNFVGLDLVALLLELALLLGDLRFELAHVLRIDAIARRIRAGRVRAATSRHSLQRLQVRFDRSATLAREAASSRAS